MNSVLVHQFKGFPISSRLSAAMRSAQTDLHLGLLKL